MEQWWDHAVDAVPGHAIPKPVPTLRLGRQDFQSVQWLGYGKNGRGKRFFCFTPSRSTLGIT